MMDVEKPIKEEGEGFKMNLKVLEKNKEKLIFLVKGSTNVFVNTLRRMIIEEVPTLAIEDVSFLENSSALYDEIIAHRLGLVVLKTDLKSYDWKKLKEKKKSALTGVTFKLKVKGPANVYAEELKFKDPKVKAVYPKTLIVKLLKGQNLKIEGTAVLGVGKDHTKFSPGLVYFNSYPKIEILKPLIASGAVKVCPKHVFRLANKKLEIYDLLKCDLCMACVKAYPDTIKVEGSKTDFIVYVESWGQLKIKDMIQKAIEILNDKLDEFRKLIK